MGKISGANWQYYLLETRLIVRCQNNDIEVLTGAKDSLKWTTAIAYVDEISRMIPKNATRISDEENAKELYLRQIEFFKH